MEYVTVRTPDQQELPWQPEELVQRLLFRSPQQLVREFGSYFLLVRLNDFSRELALGLQNSQPSPGKPEQKTLAFTISGEQMKQMEELSKAARDAPRALPRGSLPVEDAPLPPEWLHAPCYLLTLKNRLRSGQVTLDIGRSASNDIVLNHASVSGQHAQLLLGGLPSVRDLDSRNRTLVDGELISDWRQLSVGNILKFGAVQAVLCSPSSLLTALKGRLALP